MRRVLSVVALAALICPLLASAHPHQPPASAEVVLGDPELFTVLVFYRDSDGIIQEGQTCGVTPRDEAIACAAAGLQANGYRLDVPNERGATFVPLTILAEPVRVTWVPEGPGR